MGSRLREGGRRDQRCGAWRGSCGRAVRSRQRCPHREAPHVPYNVPEGRKHVAQACEGHLDTAALFTHTHTHTHTHTPGLHQEHAVGGACVCMCICACNVCTEAGKQQLIEAASTSCKAPVS